MNKKKSVIDLTNKFHLLKSLDLDNNDYYELHLQNFDYENFIKSNLYNEYKKQKKEFKEYLINISESTSEGEEKIFSLQNGDFLYFVNNKYIYSLKGTQISIFSNKFEPLFSILTPFGYYKNLSYNIISKNFFFSNDNKKINFKIKMDLEKSILLKEKSLKIFITKSIKSIHMIDDDYLVNFSNNLYSSIKFNSSLEIIDVSISETLKRKLKSTLVINNVHTYSDIKDAFLNLLKDDIEIYNLCNDEKIVMKGSQDQFDQDLYIAKKLINIFGNISEQYKKYLKINNDILSFYDLKVKNNDPGRCKMNNLILENYIDRNFINNNLIYELQNIKNTNDEIIEQLSKIPLVKRKRKTT